MATFTNQRVFLDQSLRPFATAIFGPINNRGGFQWRVGTSHPNDPNSSNNSDKINQALIAAGVSPQEYVVVVLEP